MKTNAFFRYFSAFELLLWGSSVLAIFAAFFWSGEFYPLTLVAALLGVTALLFLAKGNVLGQFLTIAFSLLYALVSLRFRYWGELLTYLGMSLPAAAFACVSWLKHPSKQGKREVAVGRMTTRKWIAVSGLALAVTLLFFFLLRALDTPNLGLSTLSVTTSCFAAALVFLRSRAYAIAYACNDLVLVCLWTLACLQSLSYLPMVVCFLVFFVNDGYAFFHWKRLAERQSHEAQRTQATSDA